jgi:penicillin-binding protein 1C
MMAAEQKVAGHVSEEGSALAGPPANVVRRQVCALSGMAANPWCPTRTAEWLPSEEAQVPCSWHHGSDEGLLTVWPAAYRQWAAEHGLLANDLQASPVAVATSIRSVRLQPDRISRDDHHAQSSFAIANPPAGAVYLVDPTLRSDFQTLPLRAAAGNAGMIEWTIDGKRLGASPSDTPLQWPLVSGAHRIHARDARGRVAEVSILVK